MADVGKLGHTQSANKQNANESTEKSANELKNSKNALDSIPMSSRGNSFINAMPSQAPPSNAKTQSAPNAKAMSGYSISDSAESHASNTSVAKKPSSSKQYAAPNAPAATNATPSKFQLTQSPLTNSKNKPGEVMAQKGKSLQALANANKKADAKKSALAGEKAKAEKAKKLEQEMQKFGGNTELAITQFLTQLSSSKAASAAPKANESIKDIMSKVESSFATAQHKAEAAQMMQAAIASQGVQSKPDVATANQLVNSMATLINDVKHLYPMNAVIRHPKLGEIKVKVDNPTGDEWDLELKAETEEGFLRLAGMKKKLEEGLQDETSSDVNIELVS
ncbi:hypothetical protein CS022_17105 [Veronia nyctiphanis]|uniref:Flagellar hook-length control protein FliK n=1 Tax=Veronia nyctiphanis TaxID=1278244 RepID=A0A4Q0YP29_9GAMM|nr:hypothetical protein [Veronia nyctiphanis]RXJ72263.1 hypothetical protein CS022_17105 [Veronia nyctiphanis]